MERRKSDKSGESRKTDTGMRTRVRVGIEIRAYRYVFWADAVGCTRLNNTTALIRRESRRFDPMGIL